MSESFAMATQANDDFILYDITSILPDKAWSPNTWKIRCVTPSLDPPCVLKTNSYALKIKDIPFKTCWLKHPDIEPELRRIGAPPTIHFFSGTQRYTLPAIFDPRTQTAVSDSVTIALHLDMHYPESRPLFPPGTQALQRAWAETRIVALERAIFPLLFVRVCEVLSPETRGGWRERREGWLGQRLEDLAPTGPKRDAALSIVLKELDVIEDCLQTNEESETAFVMGNKLSYCDVALAGTLTCMRRLLGEESSEWRAVMRANKGRWSRLMDAFVAYEVVDD
jgi:glutathione S-transferase